MGVQDIAALDGHPCSSLTKEERIKTFSNSSLKDIGNKALVELVGTLCLSRDGPMCPGEWRAETDSAWVCALSLKHFTVSSLHMILRIISPPKNVCSEQNIANSTIEPDQTPRSSLTTSGLFTLCEEKFMEHLSRGRHC